MEWLKKYKELIQIILVIISFSTFLWGMFTLYEKVIDTMKKTQQMALKSIIWNDNVPLQERIKACDDYIELGFNSYTKEYCRNILVVRKEK